MYIKIFQKKVKCGSAGGGFIVACCWAQISRIFGVGGRTRHSLNGGGAGGQFSDSPGTGLAPLFG